MVGSASTTASSKIPKCLSDWSLKVWESLGITEFHLVIQTLQDTNTWHLQQGSLDVCEFYLVLGILADKSEEAVVKW